MKVFAPSPDRAEVGAHSRIGIIIPACNEEECIARVLSELLGTIDPQRFVVAVGVNDSTDRTAEIAQRFPVIVAETPRRGYGQGCCAAIEALTKIESYVSAYIFFAGDGASDPRDVHALATGFEQGYGLVLAARTTSPANWSVMGISHVIANLLLGLWAGFLGGHRFRDLGPLRLIERSLFEAIAPREMTFGWTIEAQVAAGLLQAEILEVHAGERPRLAGQQKVSGVTWRRTFIIGCRIVAAGWRTRSRMKRRINSTATKARATQASETTR